MGKQVQFYMSPADELEFMALIKKDRAVAVLPRRLRTQGLEQLHELPPVGTDFSFSVWLWDSSNSPEPIVKPIAAQRTFCIDEFSSEVIDFQRSVLDRGRLVAGRIWAEMYAPNTESPSQFSKKGDWFEKWFDKLARWIRRKGNRDKEGIFVLPGAQEFARLGNRLVASANVP